MGNLNGWNDCEANQNTHHTHTQMILSILGWHHEPDHLYILEKNAQNNYNVTCNNNVIIFKLNYADKAIAGKKISIPLSCCWNIRTKPHNSIHRLWWLLCDAALGFGFIDKIQSENNSDDDKHGKFSMFRYFSLRKMERKKHDERSQTNQIDLNTKRIE